MNTLFEFDHTIKSNGKDHLSEIISDDEYKRWFNTRTDGKIIVLNKGRCGNGGTTGFINYAKKNFKGLSIIVPNVSIVKSKENDSEICCLYGGVKNIDRNKNIRIATWDLQRVLESFPQFGVNFENQFWGGSTLVVDEYHKLITDCNFREICSLVVKNIVETKNNVVLMSATPDMEFVDFLREVSGKEVVTYNVEYDDNYYDKIIQPLQWIDRKKGQRLFDILSQIMTKVQDEGRTHQAVFFYNNVDAICDIINQLPDTSNVEVLCSKNRDIETIPCYSEKFNKDKMFHFCTSAYFTGWDIDIRIDKVVIIGGNSMSNLSYSNKEIKQILGRCRGGYDSSFLLSDGRAIDKNTYFDFVAKKKQFEYFVKNVRDDAKKDLEFIKYYLNYLYYDGMIESMDGWLNFESFKKMMAIYPEYECRKIKIGDPEIHKRKRDISFKVYKEKRLKGEIVPYTHQAICEKYIKLCGLEKFKKATRNEIERYVKINDKVGSDNIDLLSKEDKYNMFLGDGFYRGSYLKSVLDFLGEKCDYDNLEEKMNEVFGCFCIYDVGKNSEKRKCLYLCLMNKKLCGGVEQGPKSGNTPLLYIKEKIAPEFGTLKHPTRVSKKLCGGVEQGPKFCDTPLLYIKEKIVPEFGTLKHPTRVSKKIGTIKGTNYGITDYLFITDYKSLLSTEHKKKFFSKILEDPSLIVGIKETPDWKELFDEYKKEQTMISEFYKDVPPTIQYPHHKDEMEYIDCLIVDIDNSISYNEFQKLYENFEFIAYPSISNPDKSDWKKFRVIFPLSNTLQIPNDSLKVLKLLRRMICKYEDKNHNLGAYINEEQWEMRKHNEGKPVEISQDVVVYLDELIKSLKTYTTKFKKTKDGSFTISDYWTLETAIQYYNNHNKDGERHGSLFVIKNRLSESDCNLFADWLLKNHPDKMKHWNSHKRITIN